MGASRRTCAGYPVFPPGDPQALRGTPLFPNKGNTLLRFTLSRCYGSSSSEQPNYLGRQVVRLQLFPHIPLLWGTLQQLFHGLLVHYLDPWDLYLSSSQLSSKRSAIISVSSNEGGKNFQQL